MLLRPYQSESVSACYDFLRNRPGEHPCIIIPTGGGKTPVLATIASDAVNRWGGRVLILSHVKELLQQSADKLQAIAPGLPVGVYSAGLKSRDTKQPVIVAGIQSVYKRAGELGAFNLILIDEAHLIPPDGEGMYRTFLQDARVVNPGVRLIGLTATPYRLGSGLIYGEDCLFSDVCYTVGVRELINDGFLSPLVSKRAIGCDTSGLHMRGGDYIESEVTALQMQVIDDAVSEVLAYTQERKSILLFCAGIAHATEVCNRIMAAGHAVDMIDGETPDHERAALIARFRGEPVCGECGRALEKTLYGEVCINGHKGRAVDNPLKYLVNVNVLTTGFDAPNVDCVALLRSTASPGLYYQMVGRGFRLHPGKRDCLVLDFGGNIERHGPVDQIELGDFAGREKGDGEAPTRCCPNCKTVVMAAYSVCPECEFVFPKDKPRHESQAGSSAPLSGEVTDEVFEVMDIAYRAWTKKGGDEKSKQTLRVDYLTRCGGSPSEWVCIEHDGWAGQNARRWWANRSKAPFPGSAAEAARIANQGGLAAVREITVRTISGEKWPRVIDCVLDEVPDWIDPADRLPGDEPEEEADEWGVPVQSRMQFTQEEVPF